MAKSKKDRSTPSASEGKQTTLDPETRRTGQGALESDVRPGAEPEAPGNKNRHVEGSPNQGTEAR
jgi:photosystem I subunit 4